MTSRRFFKLIALVSILCCSAFFFLNSTPTHAAKNVKKMAKFSGYENYQGATITKDYYFYTVSEPYSGGYGFYVKRCARSSSYIEKCKKSARSKHYSQKASSLYYKWGSKTISASVRSGTSTDYSKKCFNFNLNSISNCDAPPSTTGLTPGSQGQRQGWTKYKSGGKTYYLRAYGMGGTRQIYLYNSNKKPIHTWNIPVYGEPEDVMVDGDTGEVYFTMADQGNYIIFYKTTHFRKWIKPTSGTSSSNSNGSKRGKNPYINREPTNPISSLAANAENDGIVSTNFFGSLQDDGEGCGIWLILNLILTILTSGVIIAATIGMLISAITYMTAKDSPEKVIKAKKRILDIIIGLFMYAAMWSILSWLLPGGTFNTGNICKSTDSSNSNPSPENTSGAKEDSY